MKMARQYKEELSQIRLTEESKAMLTQALSGHGEARTGTKPRRSWRRTALLAAACLSALVVTVSAAGVISPVLKDYYGDSAGYQQSAISLGQSITQNGWTMTLTDCVADDYSVYVGVELTAPEGTVLDWETGYHFDYYDIPAFQEAEGAGSSAGYQQVEDDDPSDNTIRFLLQATYLWNADLDNHRMKLSFGDLYHIDRSSGEGTIIYDCKENWSFSTTLSLSDSIVRLKPNIPVNTLEAEAVITSVTVSPIGVYVQIEGDALIGHHEWVPMNAPDGWYGCVEYQEITLFTTDGTAIPLMDNMSGSGCGGGDRDHPEPGQLILFRRSDTLLDMDSLASVSICGVEIPLK